MIESIVVLRLGAFFGVLLVLALAELLRPKRSLKINKTIRWKRNLSLVVINSVFVRIVLPFTAVSVALYAERYQLGILHYVTLPSFLKIIIALLLLDLLIYAQHVVFHHVPLLWNIHKIHHIDQEVDVTTGVRFHPVEIILSTLIKCGAVLVLGIPFMAVVIFEILLNAASMFNHSNIRLPEKLDKYMRLILVTPDMHRVHHSAIPTETNRNFGFNLPWWDRIFRTYQAQPQKGHSEMTLGLNAYRDSRQTGLIALLMIPFKKKMFHETQ